MDFKGALCLITVESPAQEAPWPLELASECHTERRHLKGPRASQKEGVAARVAVWTPSFLRVRPAGRLPRGLHTAPGPRRALQTDGGLQK